MKAKDSVFKIGIRIMGIFFLGLSIIFGLRKMDFVQNADTFSGVVIENQKKRKRKASYYPIIEYVDGQGVKKTFRSGFGSKPPAYEIGDGVEILVDRRDEKRAEIKSFTALWLGPILAGIMGLIFSLIGFRRWKYEAKTGKEGMGE